MAKGQRYLKSLSNLDRTRLSEKITPNESTLVDSFLSLKTGTILKGTLGESIVVVNPGIRNDYDGPDISNASLFINGMFFKGHIECHIRAKDWFAHSHDQDLRYKNVILHVVMTEPKHKNLLTIPSIVIQSDIQNKQRGHRGNCKLNEGVGLCEKTKIISDHIWWKKVNSCNRAIQDKKMEFEFLLKNGFRIIGGKGNGVIMEKVADNLINQFGVVVERFKWKRFIISRSKEELWNSKNVRPAKRKKWVLEQANAYTLLVNRLIHLEFETPYKEIRQIIDQTMIPYCGAGSLVEIKGNILLPFFCSRAMTGKMIGNPNQVKDEWNKLMLPYTYNQIFKHFNPYFSNRQLRSFHVLQALLWLEEKYCSKENCIVCPLRLDS